MTFNPRYSQQIEQLRVIVLRRWWLISGLLWLTIGSLSLWGLRHEWATLRQYFTWTAVRYALAYNRLAAMGLGICLGLTVALLVAESRYLLFGLSKAERQRLERLLEQIQQQGSSHPLWYQINRNNSQF